MRGGGVVEEGCQKGSEKWAEGMSVGCCYNNEIVASATEHPDPNSSY